MAPPTMVSRCVAGVSGVFAVALLLFGTRWGSYIGVNPLFLTDILLACAALYWLVTETSGGNRRNRGRREFPGWPLATSLSYIVIRSLFSAEILTMVWIRDVMPFLYAGVAFMSAATYAQAGPIGRAKTMRVLWWALNGHLAWTFAVSLIGPTAYASMPFMPASDVQFLAPRPDVDMAVLGMTAGLYLRRVILRRSKAWSLVGLGLCLLASIGFHSRAGLLAVGAALAVSYATTLLAHRNSRMQNWLVFTPILLLIGGAVFTNTDAGQRLLATVGAVEVTADNQRGALGTANARDGAWEEVIAWTNDDTGRTLVGVGFGPNFMAQSGANTELGTSTAVRSPHNWFVGAYARLGVLGAGLLAITLLGAIRHMWLIRRLIGSSELLTLAAAGFIALLVVGALGVVLESPFGAIPFWWFLGILVAERRMRRKLARRRRRADRYYNRDAAPEERIYESRHPVVANT